MTGAARAACVPLSRRSGFSMSPLIFVRAASSRSIGMDPSAVSTAATTEQSFVGRVQQSTAEGGSNKIRVAGPLVSVYLPGCVVRNRFACSRFVGREIFPNVDVGQFGFGSMPDAGHRSK